MVAILTKYLPCTNTKGSRIVADAGRGRRVIVSYDCGSNDPHRDGAIALCAKMEWGGELMEGHLEDGRSVFIFTGKDHRNNTPAYITECTFS